MSAHEVVHHGWLTKSPCDASDGLFKNIFKKKWKRRYFVLTVVTPLATTQAKGPGLASSTPSLNSVTYGNNINKTATNYHNSKPTGRQSYLELAYFENEKRTKKLGNIDLTKCEEILSHLNSNVFDHVFAIKTYYKGDRPRTYYLVTDTEQDMVHWVTQLCHCLKMVNDNSQNRYSNRSSAGSNTHHHIQPVVNQYFQRQLSMLPGSASRSANALECRSLCRTPTPHKKPVVASVDYTDDAYLSTLPRLVTLNRMDSISSSRTNVHSPQHFNSVDAPLHLSQTSFKSVPQCPPPSNYHAFLPLLVSPSSTLPRPQLNKEVEHNLTSSDRQQDKSFIYFTEGVAQLINMQNKKNGHSDESSINGSSYYDTPTKKYSKQQSNNLYQNESSACYDVPTDRMRSMETDSSIYSKEDFTFRPRTVDDGFADAVSRETFRSLPETHSEISDIPLVVYSVPSKIKSIGNLAD